MTYQEMVEMMEKANWSTESKLQCQEILLDRLTAIQNTPRNANRDIMTFSGFCKNIEQLYDYVELQAA